jgi:hypothetical protein
MRSSRRRSRSESRDQAVGEGSHLAHRVVEAGQGLGGLGIACALGGELGTEGGQRRLIAAPGWPAAKSCTSFSSQSGASDRSRKIGESTVASPARRARA